MHLIYPLNIFRVSSNIQCFQSAVKVHYLTFFVVLDYCFVHCHPAPTQQLFLGKSHLRDYGNSKHVNFVKDFLFQFKVSPISSHRLYRKLVAYGNIIGIGLSNSYFGYYSVHLSNLLHSLHHLVLPPHHQNLN